MHHGWLTCQVYKMNFLFSSKDVESYIHRSGRTGRAGRTGICVCFYQPRERGQLRYVEQKAVSKVKLSQLSYQMVPEKRVFMLVLTNTPTQYFSP